MTALTEIAFAEEVLGRLGPSPEVNKALRSRLRAIRRRLDDPTLQLALLGEFSSGKSSFVNAVLRRRLLSTSVLPSTAVPTRIRHGVSTSLAVQFVRGRRALTCAADAPDLSATEVVAYVLAVHPALGRPERFEDVVRWVTTEPQVTPSVRFVDITHPAPLLGGDVALLDLPGINADANPAAVREAVSELADATVVVLAADVGLTNTLVEFLRNVLDQRSLERCGFLVTKITRVEPPERAEVLESVRLRLGTELGLVEPAVWPVAVSAVLPRAGASPSGEDRRWAEDFTRVEQQLVARVRGDRETAAAEAALRALEDVLGEVGAQLAVRDRQAEERLAAVEHDMVRDLSTFAAEQRAASAATADRAGRQARQVAERLLAARESAVRAAARDVLRSAADRAALRRAVESEIPRQVEQALTGLEHDLRRQAVRDVLEPAAREAGARIDRTFRAEYRTLATLRGRPDLGPLASSDLNSLGAGTISAVRDLAERLRRESSLASAGAASGAVGGAAIGTLLMPGLGTLLGVAVGGGLGSRLRRGMATLQSRSAESVERELDELFASLHRQVAADLDAARDQLAAAQERRIAAYVRRYAKAIAGMQAEVLAERQAVAASRGELAELRRELGRRRAAVRRSRQATGRRSA